jgi:outer membrane protein TolC
MRIYFIRWIIGIGLIIFSMPVFAEKALELSLQDAVMLALRKNPNVQSAEIQRIVDKLTLRTAEWQYEWQYSLKGAANHTDSVTGGIHAESDTESLTPGASLLIPIGTTFNVQMINPLAHTAGFARYYNPSVTVSATQPLLQGAGRDIVLAPLYQAQNTELLARLTFKTTIMQTITDVISQYAALVQAQNSLEAQRLSLKNLLATLKQQRAFLKTGRIAPADLVQFDASVASQKLQLQEQTVSLLQQQRNLLITLGIDPSIPIKTSNKVQMPNETLPNLAECYRLALENNIAYQQELINLKQTKIALALAIDKARPSLNFTAQRTQGGGSGGYPNSGLKSLTNGANTNTQFGLVLTVPIDNVSLKAAVSSAKVALDQENIKVASQKRQVILTVTNDYNTILNQKSQIIQAQIAVKLAQKSLDIAQAKLRFGKVSPFEVSTLQNSLITQKLSEISVIDAYITNLATLDQDVGITLDRWGLHLIY